MARSILCYDSVLKVGAFKSHRRLETVHSRALFFHFQVLLSVQTKAKGSRQTGLADWCLGGGGGSFCNCINELLAHPVQLILAETHPAQWGCCRICRPIFYRRYGSLIVCT